MQLALCVQGDGDTVTATALPGQSGVVRIDAIAGDGGRLTLEAGKNCVGIAAAETAALLEAALGSPLACGIALQLQKVPNSLERLPCLIRSARISDLGINLGLAVASCSRCLAFGELCS